MPAHSTPPDRPAIRISNQRPASPAPAAPQGLHVKQYGNFDFLKLYDIAPRRTLCRDSRGEPWKKSYQVDRSTRDFSLAEFERGALIDERTTVFTLGRTMSVFLSDGELSRGAFRGTDRQYRTMKTACGSDPAARFQRVAELAQAWRS